MSRWLSDEEVAALTKRKRPSDQVKILLRDGVPFRMVAGRPIVLESALEPVAHSDARPRVRKLA